MAEESVCYQVVFQPAGLRGDFPAGTKIIEAARALGVSLEAVCGGQGKCGKCRVQIEPAPAPPTGSEQSLLGPEECAAGYRLACCATVTGDLTVFVPQANARLTQFILTVGRVQAGELDPAVSTASLRVPPASWENPADDWIRLEQNLSYRTGQVLHLQPDLNVLQKLPRVLEEGKGEVTAVVWQDREVIEIWKGGGARLWGIALDLGTTTLAAYLCDLSRGCIVGSESLVNPQVAFGEDVLARISYASTGARAGNALRRVVRDGINALVERLCAGQGINPEDIVDMVIVGNSVMHHLLLGIDPRGLGKAPFVPGVRRPLDLKARDLGIKISPGAYVHFLPLVAAFVGADNAAVLLAEKPYLREEVSLILDLGTNGEVVLGNRERLLVTSCATGPAFEGAQIQCGMRAAPGAIARVRLDPETGTVKYRLIGLDGWFSTGMRSPAVGICGSGLVDAVAQLLRFGIILPNGRFNEAAGWRNLRRGRQGLLEFVLVPARDTDAGRDLVLTQRDIRAVQLAKAALYTGAWFLLNRYEIEEPDRVVLAGGFGTFINPISALTLGLFPDCNPCRVEVAGNAAGDGAILALFDRKQRLEAAARVDHLEFVEIATEPNFTRVLADAMHLPHRHHRFPKFQAYLEKCGEEENYVLPCQKAAGLHHR